MNSNYDNSWDLIDTEEGTLPVNERAFENICKKWAKRSWEAWLKENLSFPFIVKRTGDEDDAYFTDVADREPFRLGHEIKVIGVEQEDDLCGIILKVKEGRRVGYVPLCDVELVEKKDSNFWPVREYAVWFANR